MISKKIIIIALLLQISTHIWSKNDFTQQYLDENLKAMKKVTMNGDYNITGKDSTLYNFIRVYEHFADTIYIMEYKPIIINKNSYATIKKWYEKNKNVLSDEMVKSYLNYLENELELFSKGINQRM